MAVVERVIPYLVAQQGRQRFCSTHPSAPATAAVLEVRSGNRWSRPACSVCVKEATR